SYEHPEDPCYIGIDCGIVGSLNKDDKRYLAENFIAFFILRSLLYRQTPSAGGRRRRG
ncbi:hypothetical protein ISX56_30890, partial [Serratia ureilytica]|nr:hypothetical protein [Serratia ureilytica]